MNTKIFIRLKEYLEVINEKYVQAIIYFHIHDSLKKSRANNLIGKDEAGKNLKVLNKYKYILGQPVEIGMMNLAIIELYKIFENDNDCITIHKIINYIQTNIEYINKKILNEFKKKGMKGNGKITNDFLVDLKKDINRISNKIKNLKLSRDNRSHSLKKLKQELLTYKDIEDIHNIFDKIYNSLTLKIKSGIIDYSYIEKNIGDNLDFLLKSLKTFHGINIELLKYFSKEKYSKITKDDKNILIDILRKYY